MSSRGDLDVCSVFEDSCYDGGVAEEEVGVRGKEGGVADCFI